MEVAQNTAMPCDGPPAAAAGAGGRDGLNMRIELGRRWIPARDVSRLDVGSIVELDCAAEEYVELYVGGQLAARGEAVAVAGKLGVRVQEIVPGA
jgi:flagellar motor switch protein FliN